jgi:ADP-heptose:LPS heptosyltransferase
MNVLVLRALNLGDLLAAVPALRAIRRHWPRHRIVLATHAWLEPFVELTGAVDELLPAHELQPLTAAAGRPDVAINLHGRGPQSAAVLDAVRPRRRIGHAGPGWPGPAWQPELHERVRWCRLLTWHGVEADPSDLHLRPPRVPSPAPGAVVVHIGAGYRSRLWPASRFAAVAGVLARRGHHVVITGGPAEVCRALEVAALAGLPQDAVLAGRTPPQRLAALVAGADLLISADTGVAHLSYAYRTPSVVLFGPAPARHWGPPADGPHAALSRDDLRRGDAFADDPDPALLGVDERTVLDAALRLLERPGPLGAPSSITVADDV